VNTILSGEHIVKSYGEGAEKSRVLDGVSVEIREGEFIAIMGPSGSGKSTLMYTLSGMDNIDGGKVVFNGRELSSLGERELADIRRKDMGFVFQQPTLLKNLNLMDNIILPSLRDKGRKAGQLRDKAQALMTRTGIRGLEKRNINQASGGQLQRAGICRALMNDPKIIFGDEPTGALNSTSAQEIMALLGEIHQDGTTILLVTHDIKVAARAERVLFLLDGKITGEYIPGMNDKSREESLTAWLVEREL
jgi:putative ABC transport system ATP-binding protein